mgnify:CR=1 FL=1|jgi:hypothetical protein
MPLTIALETPVVTGLVPAAAPARIERPASPPAAFAANPFLFEGEALTALLKELCAEGSLSREQLRTMVQAAERLPTAAVRRTA